MATRSIHVEIDEELIGALALLGEPSEVLADLARSAVFGALHASHRTRKQTNESLRLERHMSDSDENERAAKDEAHRVETVGAEPPRDSASVPSARAGTDRTRGARSIATTTVIATDTDLVRERRRRQREAFVATERADTDKDLRGERANHDALLHDQLEANATMVGATIRAQELTDEAVAATRRAEKSEREHREIAEFREMFIGVLGHDLRNPIAAIVMSATILLRRALLDEQDSETVTRIIRSSQRITRMITQLLDLTRARLGGGLVVERKPMDLRELCQNTVEEFDSAIDLVVDGDLTGCWDADRLTEVLSNLTGNAIEYATPGTRVTVSAHADDNGDGVVLEVSNHGVPIPADVLPVIFEPFRRAKQREKSSSGNLGLGLYIAYQIVLAHEGTLEARSAGGITTFAIRLPRRHQGAPTAS